MLVMLAAGWWSNRSITAPESLGNSRRRYGQRHFPEGARLAVWAAVVVVIASLDEYRYKGYLRIVVYQTTCCYLLRGRSAVVFER